MIVLDASAAIELVCGTPKAVRIAARLTGEVIAAPHLIDLEVASGLRRAVSLGIVSAADGRAGLRYLEQLKMARFAHSSLLDRVWQLRGQLTAYDACYVALAEATGAPLVTLDRRLAAATGHGATIEVLA